MAAPVVVTRWKVETQTIFLKETDKVLQSKWTALTGRRTRDLLVLVHFHSQIQRLRPLSYWASPLTRLSDGRIKRFNHSWCNFLHSVSQPQRAFHAMVVFAFVIYKCNQPTRYKQKSNFTNLPNCSFAHFLKKGFWKFCSLESWNFFFTTFRGPDSNGNNNNDSNNNNDNNGSNNINDNNGNNDNYDINNRNVLRFCFEIGKRIKNQSEHLLKFKQQKNQLAFGNLAILLFFPLCLASFLMRNHFLSTSTIQPFRKVINFY